MDSANLHHHQHQHHHQLQDHQLVVASSPLATPSFHGSTHAWPPNTIPNPNNFNPNGISRQQQNDFLAPNSLNNSMIIQDMGFQSSHDSYRSFTQMIQSSSPNTQQDFHPQATSYLKNEERYLGEMSEKLFLRNFSLGSSQRLQFPPAGTTSRGNFSQIFPTINISDLNQSGSAISSSLDLFTSDKYSGCLSPASSDNLGIYYGLDHMQQSSHRPSSSLCKISPSFTSGVTDAKRPNQFLEPKVPQAAQKKSRSESRPSCPPIKVRKEKLGDRIAALQQMVAPFGKTDTASVLMEAIGYIKFLQNQVETLSVPYMKSSRNRTTRTVRGGSMEDGNEEQKRDLRSRGLCLVPLSCLSYVTDGGGGVWPPMA